MIRKTVEEIDLEYVNLALIRSNTKIYSINDMIRSGHLGT